MKTFTVDFSRPLQEMNTKNLKLFKENDCTTMGGWLRVYNDANVVPFIEAFKKMAGQYYPDKIDVWKDAVSFPGISMT